MQPLPESSGHGEISGNLPRVRQKDYHRRIPPGRATGGPGGRLCKSGCQAIRESGAFAGSHRCFGRALGSQRQGAEGISEHAATPGVRIRYLKNHAFGGNTQRVGIFDIRGNRKAAGWKGREDSGV